MIVRALLHFLRRQAPAAPPPNRIPAEQGLFIIGAARSGTTILQNALNDSPEIFLFGEANFHTDPATRDFAARYNAMHRAWGNQETKSTFCPPVLAHDSDWRDYLHEMALRHRLVGAKLVLNPIRPVDALDTLFAFQCRHFYASRYLFTFRDPVATILSTRDLQILLRGTSDAMTSIIRNYVDTVGLFVRMLRALPDVRAVCHEDIARDTFDRLEEWLGVRLPRSHLYYDRNRVLTYDDAGLDQATRARLASLRTLYGLLRHGAREGFSLPQLEQNNNHLNPAHLTPLGHIARQVEMITAALPDGEPTP